MGRPDFPDSGTPKRGLSKRGRKQKDANVIRAACLQNETAPEKLLNRYEKRFEKRDKGSEKRSETRLKNFSPSQAA